MNFHLKRHRKLTEVMPIPEGLQELMADIAREVLRYQPENIEEFIADYLEAMVLTRELYYVSEKTVDDILQQSVHLQEMMKKTGVSYTQSNEAVQLIKDSVKHHTKDDIKELNIVNRLMTELKFTTAQARKASEIVENVWCHYFNQNKNYVLKYKTNISDNEAVQHTLSLYRRPDISDIKLKEYFLRQKKKADNFEENNFTRFWKSPNFQQREKSAIQIQSWYRAIKDRQNAMWSRKCATVIQKNFRGYLTRKELQSKMDELNERKKGREKAAVKIQSWYRAIKDRQNATVAQKCATLIQAYFRGYNVRKKMKKTK